MSLPTGGSSAQAGRQPPLADRVGPRQRYRFPGGVFLNDIDAARCRKTKPVVILGLFCLKALSTFVRQMSDSLSPFF